MLYWSKAQSIALINFSSPGYLIAKSRPNAKSKQIALIKL
nr:MAG TPA: hypothetical protein [Caudoviricetes sp.]